MKRILAVLAAIAFTLTATAQELREESGAESGIEPDRTVIFAQIDTVILGMDLYIPKDDAPIHKCVIFSYGGGFKDNNQRSKITRRFCSSLANDGIFAIAIDYRRGLDGFNAKGGPLSMIKPVDNSVRIATEDLFRAVRFVLDNAGEWRIDPDCIILCGSSAGAIMSLQADYELCNRSGMTAEIPEEFRFAGVISFSGAVFSHEGKCDYRVHNPAPTFMLHGTADKLVTYKKIALGNLGFYGSSELVKRFKKFEWPHKIMRFEGEGHSVANRMMDNYEDVIWFIDNMAVAKRNLRIDETVKDVDHKLAKWDGLSAKGLYKK